MSIIALKKDLRQCASQKRKKTNEWFFKTGLGEYGAHDKFLGISNPEMRRIAKKYKDIQLSDLQKLIIFQYNEERLCALVILVNQFSAKKADEKVQKNIYDFYIKNIDYVNNWNLVDLSAPHIMGEYLFSHQKNIVILKDLVDADVQWQRRICILATWAFIKRGDLSLTLQYAKKLLHDDEDLMHKAVGWMLREVWKKDNKVCEKFIKDYYTQIPRTTLRYAIEKMKEDKRKKFLKGDF